MLGVGPDDKEHGPAIAAYLLEQGAKVNSRASDGTTPLHGVIAMLYLAEDAPIQNTRIVRSLFR